MLRQLVAFAAAGADVLNSFVDPRELPVGTAEFGRLLRDENLEHLQKAREGARDSVPVDEIKIVPVQYLLCMVQLSCLLRAPRQFDRSADRARNFLSIDFIPDVLKGEVWLDELV